jgi:hypothetical protein
LPDLRSPHGIFTDTNTALSQLSLKSGLPEVGNYSLVFVMTGNRLFREALLAVILLCWSAIGFSSPQSVTYGQKLFLRITGVQLTPRRSNYIEFKNLADQGDWRGFVARAMEQPEFYNTVLPQWATIYLTANKASVQPLDDAIATLIGSVGNNRDARELLTGNYSYGPDRRFGVEPSLSNNTGYEILEGRQVNLQGLAEYTPQWTKGDVREAAGLLTSRGWAMRQYSAGTNRRAVVKGYETFLCRPNDTWMVQNLSAARIRQDVDRSQGGDARIFQKECRTCHSVLDPSAGAFAFIDFNAAGTLTMARGVLTKYLHHADQYPEGYVTQDDSWINTLARSNHPTAKSFGWRGPTEGKGILEWGRMISSAKSFSACLVKRTVATLCSQDHALSDPWIEQLASEFESGDQYRLKDLFKRVALQAKCISPPTQ